MKKKRLETKSNINDDGTNYKKIYYSYKKIVMIIIKIITKKTLKVTIVVTIIVNGYNIDKKYYK